MRRPPLLHVPPRVVSAWEDSGEQVFVVRNEHRQHSLWPDFAQTPTGWVRVFGPATAEDCRAYVARQPPGRDYRTSSNS
ncbi:hypothetical protein C5E07_14435 [Pseudoclavibacter sp. RFBJ3]|uniref:MbtH family NRPS accessory protein n=1 Tax=unclassified Pseudoclavibacter TaxID=2615177 RepID=UPI000CE83B99|nr:MULTISPECIES: MbtH family NRPS accessory protein [unclassified Pseudoclavibacter]MBF4551062.1 MbtH family NRPS accessory protein [Pseudoclavibacter sp. VKM Ac-2888]PPF36139.1 hypothetical protein C5E05_11685 [Pseudoclavibacter sp. AY1H1]PPF73434.1 hypothetical protein C5B99_15835 [Pseudoclavibacter sp. Z016]PPF81468.1 hypothetical protein C5C12_14175 [Pseudoclavibacter sp. RFBJ5]PPF90799.1 hypothetical protein C5E07_14435 [Pseudoclavibacter sp. RFBJ3]